MRPSGEVRALLVGIANYVENQVLRGPLNDIQLLEKTLGQHGVSDIRMAPDETRVGLLDKMRSLVSDTSSPVYDVIAGGVEQNEA